MKNDNDNENVDNEKVFSPKILHKHIGDKNIDAHDGLFNFEKAMKNLANLDNKINMIIDIIKPKQRLNMATKRSCYHFK